MDTTDTGETTPSDEAALLADLDAELANYDAWGQIPGWEVVASADGTHGDYVQIWYDATAMANLAAPVDGATSSRRGMPQVTAL